MPPEEDEIEHFREDDQEPLEEGIAEDEEQAETAEAEELPAIEEIKSLFENARTHMANTNKRNPLVNFNLNPANQRALEVSDERSDSLFKILRGNGKSMRFKAAGNNDPDDDEEVFLDEEDEPENEEEQPPGNIKPWVHPFIKWNMTDEQKTLVDSATYDTVAELEESILPIVQNIYEDLKNATRLQKVTIIRRNANDSLQIVFKIHGMELAEMDNEELLLKPQFDEMIPDAVKDGIEDSYEDENQAVWVVRLLAAMFEEEITLVAGEDPGTATTEDTEAAQEEFLDQDGLLDGPIRGWVGEEFLRVVPDEVDEAHHNDMFIETPLGPDAMQKRLLRLAREARTAEEEQGINILYLALGFLTWYEDDNSNVELTAPLVLLPVELKRDNNRNLFRLRARLDDLSTNLSLREHLANMEVRLPEIKGTESFVPKDYFNQVRRAIQFQSRWRVSENTIRLGFFSFAKLVMLNDLKLENWPMDELRAHPLIKTLLGAGSAEETSGDPLFDDPQAQIDKLLDPAEIIQVTEADTSQTKVIEKVRHGSNLVVQGPPGTGKSQTITNLIAAAVHDGKKVLFMAEKMAALKVVQDRLKKCGLEKVALELHSNKANKQDFRDSLKQTLSAARQGIQDIENSADQLREVRDTLNNVSDLLHENVQGCDYAPYEALAEQIKQLLSRTPPPRIDSENLALIPKEEVKLTLNAINQYTEAIKKYAPCHEHPYFGCRKLDLSPIDQERLYGEIKNANQKITQLQELLASPQSRIGESGIPDTLDSAEHRSKALALLNNSPVQVNQWLKLVIDHANQPRFAEAIEIAQTWCAQRETLLEWCIDEAWGKELITERTDLALGVDSFWTRLLSGDYRRVRRTLAGLMRSREKLSPAEQLERVDTLIAGRSAEKKFKDETNFLQQAFGGEWRGTSTPFAAIAEVLDWYTQLIELEVNASLEVLQEQVGSGVPPEHLDTLNIAIDDVRTQLNDILNLLGWSEHDNCKLDQNPLSKMLNRLTDMDECYPEWVELKRAALDLEQRGQSELLQRIDNELLESNDSSESPDENSDEDSDELQLDWVEAEFLYALAEARWKHALEKRPELNELANTDRNILVEEFKNLEKKRFQDTQVRILNKHLKNVPTGNAGQMRLLRGEMARRRPRTPIRRLIKDAGEMIRRIKSVFMMSPISIAQFLEPKPMTFDLLVIDEASQVRPADALGAIIRAKQIVVVGDQKQLPPTSFFDRMTTGEGEADDEDDTPLIDPAATEMESVLTWCEARGLPQRMLEWHYRSRDPSLIKGSNSKFYDNRLVLPASPLEHDERYGLQWHYVKDGVYTLGGQRNNRPEAEAIADALAKHARETPDWSAGVVTFSSAQRNLMTEVLEHRRREDKKLDTFLREGHKEDVFVKNIENVQGDERDCVFISVGYGPTAPGGSLQTMNFGPINNEGGDRRLNVLFSRARIQCRVFSSFYPGDIQETGSRGVSILKFFLNFAQTKEMDQPEISGKGPDSPFEAAVAEEIRKLGYLADHQVGSAKFLIDLGVRHESKPGQYMLAVECDGATYHSSLSARERDRQRQEVLENLGWSFHRIWSTDWFHRRDDEVKRLKCALDQAYTRIQAGIQPEGANETASEDEEDDGNDDPDPAPGTHPALPESRIEVVPYCRFELTIRDIQNVGNILDLPDPYAFKPGHWKGIIREIVRIEGPMHQDEIAQRIGAAFGMNTTSKLRKATAEALKKVRGADTGDGALVNEGAFWMTEGQQNDPPIRDRSGATGSIRKGGMIPPVEIRKAAREIVQESGGMPPEELAGEVISLLGFKRRTDNLVSAVLPHLPSES